MIGILSWEIRHGNTVLRVISGNLNIDDQNVPAATAGVVVPHDQDLFDALDPRTVSPPRVTLSGRFTQWSSESVADLSAHLVANNVETVADLSALWSGLSVADVSALFGAPLDPAAEVEPETMDLELHVREVSHDDFTMAISLASDEALLTDWAVSSIWDVGAISELQQTMPANRVTTYVNIGLYMVLGRHVDPGPYDSQVVSGDFSFDLLSTLSMSAWEIMRPALEDGDLKLRLNPDGRGFTLQRPENSINAPAEHSWLFTPQNVSSARPVRSRTGDWYDSAMLTEEDVGGGFGYPNNRDHTRTYLERFPAGTGLTESWAENIVRRTVNRGELIDIEAPIRLGVFMRDEFTYLPDDATPGPEHQWIVKSVGYDFITATMRIRGERRY